MLSGTSDRTIDKVCLLREQRRVWVKTQFRHIISIHTASINSYTYLRVCLCHMRFNISRAVISPLVRMYDERFEQQHKKSRIIGILFWIWYFVTIFGICSMTTERQWDWVIDFERQYTLKWMRKTKQIQKIFKKRLNIRNTHLIGSSRLKWAKISDNSERRRGRAYSNNKENNSWK